ncbi:phosphate acetyltransferase, partial [bacterium]|nr:phosphate acetyltransferase [bacterium]
MITGLGQMAEAVRSSGIRKKIAVAWAQDPNTVGSLYRAAGEGFVEAFMIGRREKIISTCMETGADPDLFTIVEADDEKDAAEMAVAMTRSGETDIVMKGLVGTDRFLKAVMDKEKGLLPPKAVMSYVCAVEIPAYRKLLFITDTAVIPFP